MVNKMPGYKTDKYANLRAGYAYMLGHSGKKLLFMGQDFGQEREWSEARELDWFLLQEDLNRGLHDYVKNLLELYNKYPCLYEIDNSWDGFEWLNCDDKDRSTYSFFRKASNGKNNLMSVSYKHLDVYKRQGISPAAGSRHRKPLKSLDFRRLSGGKH